MQTFQLRCNLAVSIIILHTIDILAFASLLQGILVEETEWNASTHQGSTLYFASSRLPSRWQTWQPGNWHVCLPKSHCHHNILSCAAKFLGKRRSRRPNVVWTEKDVFNRVQCRFLPATRDVADAVNSSYI